MTVTEELARVERENPITIVNARQRGSRMLNVVHEDSDYDCMFLFAQEPVEYAKLQGPIRTIDEPHVGEDGDIDLHGWNITKFAMLASDSNPNAVEYCRPNPVEHYTPLEQSKEAFAAVENEVRDKFNHMSLYHHYISMAKNNYMKYVESGNDCTKGRQFYVARAIACAHFVRKAGRFPPMDVDGLIESDEVDDDLSGVLEKLTRAKRAGHGEQENPDIVGPLYEAESDAEMEATDERINSPDDAILDQFIESVLR